MNITLPTQSFLSYFFQKTTKALGCIFLLFLSLYGNAQVSTYQFSEASGLTYTPITGTVIFGTGWDDAVTNVGLPFAFNFNGANYNAINVSTNGFITFGLTPPANNTFGPIGASTAYNGAISVFGRDLISGSPTSNISYDVIGTAPNQVFVIQYKDALRNSLAGSGILNLQIRLYETTNVIETWYDTMSVPPTNTGTLATHGGQVGLRGATNAWPVNVNNRAHITTIDNWPPTTAGATGATNPLLLNQNCRNLSVTRFTWTPPCFSPSTPLVTNVGTTTADISWTAALPAPPGGYQWEIRSSGLGGSGAIGLEATDITAANSATATGLPEGTTMRLYVRSLCNSTWLQSAPFTTTCTASNVPYFLYFDPGSDGFTLPALPSCTLNRIVGLSNSWVTGQPGGYVNEDSGFFDEHAVYIGSTVNAANAWFITKGVNLAAGQTYRLEYIYGGSSQISTLTNRMEVRYGTTPTAAGLAASTQLQDHPEIKSSGLGNIITFTAPTSDVYYIGFRAYSAANNNNLYLDDIQLTVSTCLQPTGLTAPAVLISFNNATITWTAPTPAPASGYAYYISTVNTPPTNTTPPSGTVPAGTTITTIPSLTPNTTYYVWVRSNCGGGEFGEWSANTSFTTEPAPPVYCIPNGTSVDGTGLTNVTFGSINNTTGSEAATNYYGNYSGLTTNIAQGATVPISLTFSTSIFDYFVKIWIDWNNDGDFDDAGEEVYSGETVNPPSPSVLNVSFNVPLGADLGPKRLRIGGIDDPIYTGGALTSCRNGAFQTFEDYTVNVIVAPPALTLSQTTMPAQCGLTDSPDIFITSVLADYDVYTWSPSTGVTGDPVSGYTFNNSATTTYILTASQTSGAFSTNSVSFTYVANETPTPITIDTPDGTIGCVTGPPIELNASGGIVSNLTVFSENFNSGINGPGQFTSSNTSSGGTIANSVWTVRPEGYTATGPSWFATFSSNDDTSFVFSNSDSQGLGSTTRTRLTSPPIDLTTYTAATASFYHFYQAWGNDIHARVEVTINGGADWTILNNYTTNQGTATNFTQAFLNLNPYVGNIIQIRFDYQTQWGWGWAIDNFRVVGSATSAIVWTPATGLYTNAAGTIPYVAGTGAAVVYALPSSDTIYTATSTAPGPTFCESTQTVSITVPALVGGTLSANQASCSTADYTNITLSGHTGDVVRWEYADDAAFTVGVTTIANTTTTLTPAEFGTITSIRYFRAVVSVGTCNPVYSSVASVSANVTVLTGTNSWSNGTPDITKKVVIAGNYTATANFEACSVQVLSGGTLTVSSGVTVTVENEFVVDGPSLPTTVVFQNNASLIQLTDAVNSGAIRYERNTTPVLAYDYTYWSSPVAGQTLGTFSPNTNPSRFYVFDHPSYSWQNISTASVMEAAKGYIIRAPGNFSTTVPAVFTGGFYGVPHNGPYSISLGVTGLLDRNLVGNPYPSAIDADLLYAANLGVLQGSLFFWTHNTPITANNYDADDYATYNLTGGTGTASPNAGVNTTIPNGNIAAGQGFFVQALSAGSLNFTNSMRLTGLNNLFYRSAEAPSIPTIEKHRLWITLINNQGAYKQMLIGYIQGATNEVENAFDSELTEAGNVVSLYTINSTKKLTIEGRGLPFIPEDVVPVGYRTSVPGTFDISLENFDGLFEEGQNVYVKDNWLNITHNLKESNYSFTTEAGTFDDRFEIVYLNSTLGVTSPSGLNNAVVVYKNNQTIFINSSTYLMETVRIFDVRGSLIAEQKAVNGNETQFVNLNIANQMLLIQITTQEGAVVVKKVAY